MRLRKSLATAVAAVALSGTALTTGLTSAGAAGNMATVTVIHGIPKVPVTVYANNNVLIANFIFGKSVGPVELAAGTYKLDIRPRGASVSTKPILTKTVTLTPGYNATVSANLTSLGKPVINAVGNPLTDPAAGNARVIVRHMAEAPGVDVYAGATTGAPLISNLKNGTGAGTEVPAGTYSISVYVHGTKTGRVLGPLSLKLDAGKTYIVYAIGSAVAKPSSLTVVSQSYQNVLPTT